MGEKRSKTGIISVRKPTWFPLEDETGNFPVYGTALLVGITVNIKPVANYETTQDYGDSMVQDQFTAFGGAEVELEANGYTHKVLPTITGGKIVKDGTLRSREDIMQDGAFVYRRKKSNGKYRYTVFYKERFALDSDETSTTEGSKISFTYPTWKGPFVDVPGLGYMYLVDEDDEGADKAMIGNWFTKVAIPIEEAELSGGTE